MCVVVCVCVCAVSSVTFTLLHRHFSTSHSASQCWAKIELDVPQKAANAQLCVFVIGFMEALFSQLVMGLPKTEAIQLESS